MIMALARKEFRELLPLVAIALLVQFVVVSAAMNVSLGVAGQRATIPFLDKDSIWTVFAVGGIFAVAAGLRQTIWESARGTFQVLLHRPVQRETIFYIKLAAGGTSAILVLVLPLAVYSLWAATPGTHASPFFWSMSAWAWQLPVEMLPLYLAAFLCGLRPARWYASRFLPLAATGALVPVVTWTVGMTLPWQIVSVTISSAVGVACIIATIYIARSRDFS